MLPCAAHHSALALAVTMLTAGYELGHVTSFMGGGMQVLTTAPSSPPLPHRYEFGQVTSLAGPDGMQVLTTAPSSPHRYEFGQVTSLAGPDGRYGTQLLMLSASLIAPDDVTDCT